MKRPVTLFTGQWADLTLEEVCKKAVAFGYDGLELACWGDHIEVEKADQAYCDAKLALLKKYNLKLFSISTHLVGQAVCDNPDIRHKGDAFRCDLGRWPARRYPSAGGCRSHQDR